MNRVDPVVLELRADIRKYTSDLGEAQRTVDGKLAAIETRGLAMGDKLKSGFNVAKTAMLAFAAAGATQVFANAIKAGLDFAQSMERSAQVANAGVEEFQRAAYAARSVGIESEKLADIYKDVNDKVGEFVATGGGELKDFFENIAPKVGVTADQFKRLSGPEALQLYVSSLENAGLSQQQMTFYMEALANDATMLLPLLRENGTQFQKLAADADHLGIVMDEALVAKAGEASKTLKSLNSVMEAKLSIAVAENIDSIMDLVNALAALIDKAGGAVKAWQNWKREVAARQQEEFAKGWFISDEQRQQHLDNARRLRGEPGPRKTTGFGAPLPANLMQRLTPDARFTQPYSGIMKAQLGAGGGVPFVGGGIAGGLAALSAGGGVSDGLGKALAAVRDINAMVMRMEAEVAAAEAELTGDPRAKARARDMAIDAELAADIAAMAPAELQAGLDMLRRQKAALEKTANNQELSADLSEKEAKARQDALDAEGPGMHYVRALQSEGQAIGDTFEEAAVRGLDRINAGLSDSVKHALGLHGVLGDIVGDFIEIALRQALIRPLAESLFGGSSGGGGGELWGGLLSAAGSVFGSKGRASGGYVNAGQFYRVNESAGSGKVEGFIPQDNGMIVPLGRMNAMAAGGGQGGGIATVRLELSGDIDARIQQVSGPVAVEVVRASSPTIINAAARETMARSQRPRI